jgi:hypothetical protein
VGLVTIVPHIEMISFGLGPQCPWEHTKEELENIVTKM